MHRMALNTASAGLAALTSATAAVAAVTVTDSLSAWQAQTGPDITHVTFEGFGTPGFTNQYAALGLTDPEPNDHILFTSNIWTDHWILSGDNPFNGPAPPFTITLDLASPVHAIGLSYAAQPKLDLFLGDMLVAGSVTLPAYDTISAGYIVFGFAGVTSDQAFDRVVVKPPNAFDGTSIDDFWFQSVPAPGGVALLALGALVQQRRTQRHSERR